MLGYLFIFLPFLASLAGSVLFISRRDKSFAQLHCMMMLICMGLYFFADAIYMIKDPDYHLLIYSDILSQFISASIPFMTFIYLRSMFEHTTYGERIMVYFLPGIFMGLGATAFYFIIGIDECADFLKAVDNYDTAEYSHKIYSALLFWTDTLYSIIMGIEFLALFVWEIITLLHDGYEWGKTIQFFRGKSTISSAQFATIILMLLLLVNGIRLLAGRTFLIEHPVFSYAMSFLTALLIAATIDIAYWYKITDGYISEFQHRSQRKKSVNPDLLLPAIYSEDELDSLPLSRLMFENCGLRIYNLFEVEKAHADGKLTLKKAAEITGLSKRTIKATIASLCQCNFKDMVAYYVERDSRAV